LLQGSCRKKFCGSDTVSKEQCGCPTTTFRPFACHSSKASKRLVEVAAVFRIKYREGAPIPDDDAIAELCAEASDAIVVTKSASDFGVHNTKSGKDMLRIPAFAFLYLLGHAEKNGYKGIG